MQPVLISSFSSSTDRGGVSSKTSSGGSSRGFDVNLRQSLNSRGVRGGGSANGGGHADGGQEGEEDGGGGTRSVCSDIKRRRYSCRQVSIPKGFKTSIKFLKAESDFIADDESLLSQLSPLTLLEEVAIGGGEDGSLAGGSSNARGKSSSLDAVRRLFSARGIHGSAVFDLRVNSFLVHNDAADSSLDSMSIDSRSCGPGDIVLSMIRCGGGKKDCVPAGEEDNPATSGVLRRGGKFHTARQISLVFVFSLLLLSIAIVAAVLVANNQDKVRDVLPASTVKMAVQIRDYVLEDGDGEEEQEHEPFAN